MLFREYQKTIKNPVFWFAVFAYVLCLVLGLWEEIPGRGLLRDGTYTGGVLCYFQYSMIYGFGEVLLPVFTIFPAAFLYLEERNGFWQYNIIRTTKEKYIRGKIGAALLSGMTLLIIAFFVFCVLIYLWFPAGWGELYMDYTDTIYAGMVETGQKKTVFMLYILGCLCEGLPWPVMALVFSTFTNNRFVVLAMPMIIWLLLSFLGESLDFFYIIPSYIGIASLNMYNFGGGWPYTILYTVIFVASFSLLFRYRARRSFIE